jgi:YHS domain-containing protein
MKSLLTLLALSVVASIASAAPVNSTCIMSGKPIKDGVTSEYKGKTVGFCCTNCKARFDSNPDKFGKKIAK